MTGTKPQEWMTLAEAAEYARCVVDAPKHPVLSFLRWARKVKLPLYPWGRSWRVEVRELNYYMKLQGRIDADKRKQQRGPRRIPA